MKLGPLTIYFPDASIDTFWFMDDLTGVLGVEYNSEAQARLEGALRGKMRGVDLDHEADNVVVHARGVKALTTVLVALDSVAVSRPLWSSAAFDEALAGAAHSGVSGSRGNLGTMPTVSITEALRRAPREPLPWTAWVDTCVLVDFQTTISMDKNHTYGDHAVEATRKCMRDAAWLAIALDLQEASTVTAGYEIGDHFDRRAPPGTPEGFWTHLVTNTRDYVCPRWQMLTTMQGEVTDPSIKGQDRNDIHDDYMIAAVLTEAKVLVTRDGPAYKKAKKRKANVAYPDEYAQSVIDLEHARSTFMRRFDHGCQMLLTKHLGAAYAAENVRVSRDAYEWIWALP